MSTNPSEVRNWTIYKITSPTDRVYIGITSNFKSRIESYRNCDRRLYKQTLVYNSVRKYGFENHKVEKIDSFIGIYNYAEGKEIFWIKSFMSNKSKFPEQNGLNLTNGGDGTRGYKPTPEAIEKGRQSKIGKKASAETKIKMSKSHIGRKMNFTHITEDFRKELSERGRKLKHTEESKRKIGEAAKGNQYGVGYKMTPEQIEHRSSLIRGRKMALYQLDKHWEMIYLKIAKPIIQYTLDGEFVKEFPMISIAKKELNNSGPGINRALSGQYKQSRGFIFKYK